MFDAPRDVCVELKSDRAVTTVTRGHDVYIYVQIYAYIYTCVRIIYTTVRFGKSFGDDIDKCKTGRCEKFGRKCETAMAGACVRNSFEAYKNHRRINLSPRHRRYRSPPSSALFKPRPASVPCLKITAAIPLPGFGAHAKTKSGPRAAGALAVERYSRVIKDFTRFQNGQLRSGQRRVSGNARLSTSRHGKHRICPALQKRLADSSFATFQRRRRSGRILRLLRRECRFRPERINEDTAECRVPNRRRLFTISSNRF